jgi:fatty acid/phospholipid biosynthesis enzyme
MMTKDEALKMAIDALLYGTDHTKAVKACKEALQTNALDEMQGITQQEYYQEPVAWLSTNIKANEVIKTHQWIGLTDDEVNKIKNDYELEQRTFYARAIEAKLKDKNT